ncbi:CS1 type fimbrial major subunit [Burkholderia ubonensis]|uniref:CS1 type fimbrial major subunit n=1 Tax=Burkholderia ubonensis TaxID=101571 RepID=UPI000757093F|nr:CS1 type fimbrial major subunit [Burkholderia ubonensis]KVQ15988.1 fimbrial assembly protein [Burkholderia ubonensis]
MKIGKLILALCVSGALAGIAHAGQPSTQAVVKKITLTAHIGDSIFVSRPDGSAWYDVVELTANDNTQKTFSKTLPIRVWTKTPDFIVTLARPLRLSNGHGEMTNAKVALTGADGTAIVAPDSMRKVTQVRPGDGGGFDEIHNLKISANAPARNGAARANGSYSGDLVLLFEPTAASGDDGPIEQ